MSTQTMCTEPDYNTSLIKISNFDFSKNQFLTFESIVNGCYSNPLRSDLPHFADRKDLPFNGISKAEFMKIPSEDLITQMNNKKILLYEDSKFPDSQSKFEFLEQIK